MRTPKHDFHQNPFETVGTQKVESPTITPELIATGNIFNKNAFISSSFSFCNTKCSDFNKKDRNE